MKTPMPTTRRRNLTRMQAATAPGLAHSPASSLTGIARRYDGFDPARDGLAGDDASIELLAGVTTSRDFGLGSSRSAATADDRETVWPAPGRIESLAGRRRPERDAPVSRRRIDLEAAATLYLQARAWTDGADLNATVLAGEGEAGGQLFQELHQESPATAERLAQGLTSMPEPGDMFLGFRIVEELGRGAFGRVFLALQGDLAGRLVALKVSAEMPGESQTLAQLQHTNIVPIFSAHQAPPLHAVCMPYFGKATLADLLEDVESQESLPDSGKAFLRTVGSRRASVRPDSPRPSVVAGDSALPGATEPVALPAVACRPQFGNESESETLRAIGNLSYVDAVLWMGSRIADGLAHAHSRGILHRDLKPANVLMTDDGQPMILDFNLSEDIKAEVGASAASAGGTLRYMSPEHLERFLGGKVEVDARSDVYALGVMLYELLTGWPPFEIYSGHSIAVLRKMIADRRTSPPRLRQHNPAVSPAVESIIRHCLEPDVADRYRSAAEVHEDLERHLAHLPLRHAPEPSLRERAGKWIKRHPRVGSATTIAVVALAALVVLASLLVGRSQRLARFEATHDLASFRVEAADVKFWIGHRTTDRDHRAKGEAAARRALDRYRVLDDPSWTQQPAVAMLPSADQVHLRDEVADVLLMLTTVTTLQATEQPDKDDKEKLARSAQRISRLAMAAFAKGAEPQAFWAQQAILARVLGQEAEGDRLGKEAEKRPLLTARDHYLAAAALATAGEYVKALPLAEEATRLDPQHFWSYFILGVAHDHLEHHADAMANFTVCTALRPDLADAWLYRGLAQLKRGQPDQARADFDRAAKLRPDWYEPPLNRAIALREMGDHFKAENELTRALDLGGPAARVLFLRSAERRSLGDSRGADADQAEGLKLDPTDVPGWVSRGIARMEQDPAAALADFEGALKVDPKSLQALQHSAYVLSNMPGRQEDTIRMLGRVIDAHPGYVPARSSRGVEYAIAGRRDEAHRDARESLWRDTSPAIVYQVAGIYATTSKTNPEDRIEAYRLLATALRAGYGFDLLDIDHELDAIRDQPEFLALVDSTRGQAKERLRSTVAR